MVFLLYPPSIYCSKTSLTGNRISKLWVAPPGREPLPPCRPVRHCESVGNTGAPQGSPFSNGYGPYGILTVCRINLWAAVIMELGQEEWLKQPVAQVTGLVMAGDQGSRWGHQCSATSLTGNPSSKVWVAPPGRKPLPRVAGSKW